MCLLSHSPPVLFRLYIYLRWDWWKFQWGWNPSKPYLYSNTGVFEMNKNMNGWVKGNPLCSMEMYDASFFFFSFFFISAFFFFSCRSKRMARRSVNWESSTIKMLYRKSPKFLSCLNVVKEIYLEIIFFYFWYLSEQIRFQRIKKFLFPIPKTFVCHQSIFLKGKPEKGHEFMLLLT